MDHPVKAHWSSVLPVSDPAAVLEDGAVDGAVGGEPALHPLEVGVGDRRRGGAHHLKKRLIQFLEELKI